MDVTAIRHLNFRTLVDTRRKKVSTQKAVAIEFGVSPSFLSQLYNGKKMGDDVARKIEERASLTHGQLDRLPGPLHIQESSPTPYLPAIQSAQERAQLLAAGIALSRLASENLDIPFDAETEEDAIIVLLAIEYLAARKERTVTVDNVVAFTKRLRQANQGELSNEGDGSTGSTGRRARHEGKQARTAG